MKNARCHFLLLLLAFSVPCFAAAAEKPDDGKSLPVSTITDIAASQKGGELTVTLKANHPQEPEATMLEHPPRLVLDFKNTVNRVPFMKLPLDATFAKRLRVSQFTEENPKIARVVFDLAQNEVTHKITLDKSSIKVTLLPGNPDSKNSASAPTVPAKDSSVKPVLSEKKPVKAETAAASRKPVSVKPAAGAPAKATAAPQPSTAARASSSLKPAPVKAVSNSAPPVPDKNRTVKPVLSEKKPVKAETAAASGKPVSVKPSAGAPAKATAAPQPSTAASASSSSKPAPEKAVSGLSKTSGSPALKSAAPEKAADTAPKPSSITGTPVKTSASSGAATSKTVASVSAKSAETPVVKADIPAQSPAKNAAADTLVSAAPVQRTPEKTTADADIPSASSVVPSMDATEKAETKRENIPGPKYTDTSTLIASLQKNAPLALNTPAETAPTRPGPPPDPATARFSGELVTLDFVNLQLVDFFRVMSEIAGINIVLDPRVKGETSLKVEKLPWDQVFDMVLVNHSLDKQIEGNLIRIATKSTLQEEAKQREALKKAKLLAADLETRVKRLNYAKANTLIAALDDIKTVRGTVVEDERTNSLVMTDIPSSLNQMMELIKTLDIPQPQVEIEARIVSAVRDFAREIGIQFGLVQGNMERVMVGGPDVSSPEVTHDATPEASGLGGFNVDLPSAKAFGGLGVSVGNIFDTFLLDAALSAGESKGLAKLISQPKVTAQNNSPAVISQGTRFPVLVRANNTTTVQFYNAALTLTVTPQITYEGNIVLDLKVENNTADWARTVEFVPSIRISESESRVLVSDGGTTVIGGILIDEDSKSGDKVPGLGSLPVVGNLFRRTSVSRSTQEVLFFVTPRIVK